MKTVFEVLRKYEDKLMTAEQTLIDLCWDMNTEIENISKAEGEYWEEKVSSLSQSLDRFMTHLYKHTHKE